MAQSGHSVDGRCRLSVTTGTHAPLRCTATWEFLAARPGYLGEADMEGSQPGTPIISMRWSVAFSVQSAMAFAFGVATLADAERRTLTCSQADCGPYFTSRIVIAGLVAKKLCGISVKPNQWVGITGQSSIRVMWWKPTVYQATMSRLPVGRSRAVQAPSVSDPSLIIAKRPPA